MRFTVTSQHPFFSVFVVSGNEILYFNNPQTSWGSLNGDEFTVDAPKCAVYATIDVYPTREAFRPDTAFMLVNSLTKEALRGTIRETLTVVKICDIRNEVLAPVFMGYNMPVVDWFDSLHIK